MNSLVTTEWLASRLDDANLVILDATLPPVGVTPPVDTHARYRARHIPGAVFFDIDELSDHATTLPHMLPTAEEFSRSMSGLGVGDGMTIAVYEQAGVFSGPRAWWMLRTFGARDVFLLDGGLPAWVDAGLATESGDSSRPPASFHAVLDHDAVMDFSHIQKIVAADGQGAADREAAGSRQILDARSALRFTGAAPEPRPGISSGHMPGAINIPFTELAEAGRLKSAEKLCELFVAKGVDLSKPITTTCGSGVTAAVLALGLEIAGATNVSLYDGSWAEYAAQPAVKILKGP